MADENLAGAVSELNSIAKTLEDLVAKMPDSSGGGKAGGKTAAEKKKDKADNDRLKAEELVVSAVRQAGQSIIGFGKSMNDIAVAGARLANSLGQTVTGGIDQEFRNRNAIFKQIFTRDKDSIVAMDQMIAAQQSFASTFMGAAEGMQIGDEGVKKFAATLKTGFKSDFTLTSESMRALITAGVATGTGFENLRKASGRASLSNEQLSNLVNKNSLSFMIYGPKFAKAAQEAERLGINLAATQTAQESMVSNLDGTLDTLNQVNQLGAQIDFGTLMRLNEFEGPEATLKYLQSTIPPSLFQSASTRAMLRNLGIPLEDLMKKQGSAQDQAAKTMEDAMTKLAEPIGMIANAFSRITQILKALDESYLKQILQFGALVYSLTIAGGAIRAFGGVFPTLITMLKAINPMNVGKNIAQKLSTSVVGGGAGESLAGGAGGGDKLGEAAKGTSGFSAGNILKGAAAMLVVAAAVYVLAKGLQQFSTVNLADMGKAALALGVLAAAAFGLSFIAPAMFLGSLAIAALGASLIPFGIALRIMAPTLPLLSIFISSLSGLKVGTAVALGLLGPALISFSAGLAIASAASGLGSGIIDKITALGIAGAGVATLATAFKTLKTSLDELNAVDTSKLNDIKSFTTAATVNTAIGNITAPIAAIAARIKGGSAGAAGAETAGGTPELIRKVDELIRVLRDTKTVINVDNKLQQVPRSALAGVNIRNDRV